MKKLTTLALLLASMCSAQATLIDRGNGMVYDSTNNITWIANVTIATSLNSYGSANWVGANYWVDGLDYGGFSDWRLPYGAVGATASELSFLFTELGGVYGKALPTFHNSNYDLFSFVLTAPADGYHYWLNNGHVFNFFYGANNTEFAASHSANWYEQVIAVRSGDVLQIAPAPSTPVSISVPEPAVLAFLGLGLIGLGEIKRRQ